MAVVLWAGLRQVDAVRNSTFIAITQGSARGVMYSDDLSKLDEWIAQQELDDIWSKLSFLRNELPDLPDDSPAENGFRFGCLWDVANLKYSEMEEGDLGSDKISSKDDFGADRSSAGWNQMVNFVTTSAMIRFLAALEQFEIDALKCLFFYRPNGRGTPSNENEVESVEEDVIREQPSMDEGVAYYAKPPVWTWIVNGARNNHDRRKIFSRVYDLKLDKPDSFGWKLDELWDMRNAIAHGRNKVEISVGALLKIQNHVITSMMGLTDRIRNQYRLDL